MIIRSVDSSGDWQFGRGKNDYLQNNDAVGQDLKTQLKEFLGDCFFNIPAGIDWFSLLGSKDQVALTLALQTKILNNDYVTGIVELSLTLDSNRKLHLDYSVTTVFPGVLRQSSGYLLTELGEILTTETGDEIRA